MKDPKVKAVSVGVWLVTIAMLVPMMGCKGRALEEAQQDAREAKAKVEQYRNRLQQANRAVKDKDEELRTVLRDRAELQRKVNELNWAKEAADQEIEKAQGVAANWQNQATGQANTAATLEQQVAALTAQVGQLQATITQQQATIAQQEETISTLQTGVTQMWDGMQTDYTDTTGAY